jgi:hypothetical protein
VIGDAADAVIETRGEGSVEDQPMGVGSGASNMNAPGRERRWRRRGALVLCATAVLLATVAERRSSKEIGAFVEWDAAPAWSIRVPPGLEPVTPSLSIPRIEQRSLTHPSDPHDS